MIRLMRAIGIPNGLTGVGYGAADIADARRRHAAAAAPARQRAVRAADADALAALFERALHYW